MISRRTVWSLGLAQLISWGVSYYLVGGFGELMVADLGWSRSAVWGGFTVALLVMGLSSRLVGWLIDRFGGRLMMSAGAVLNALGCLMLAAAHERPLYYAAWVVFGFAMRLTLYDAAFAALARVGGPASRKAMSQITLLGGLASTVFWPLGDAIAGAVGWRGALLAYAPIALAVIPLSLTLPRGRYGDQPATAKTPETAPLAGDRRQVWLAGGLYAVVMAAAAILNAALSSQMIGILTGLGVGATAAVAYGGLRGVGQGASRLGEILFGARISPFNLTIVACLVMTLSFLGGLFSGRAPLIAMAFAFFYGAGNGVITITRGALPLLLFDHRSYGSLVGRLIAPGFILSAAAPIVYAQVMERWGGAGALWLSAAVAGLGLLAAIALQARFGRAART